MTYSVRIKASALKDISKVNKPDRLRIAAAIDNLKNNPQAGSILKGGLSGLRRIRVGSYRVIYEIQGRELLVLVVRIGHRSGVYRR